MFVRILRDFCLRTAVTNGQNVSRCLHVTQTSEKNRDRRSFLASVPAKDEGTEGEKFVYIDSAITKKEDMFPDMNTPNMLFDGVKFLDVPICHIKSSRNNTILQVTRPNGERIMFRSCGMEGFKNTRKGTNIAAQATAIGLATRVLDFGVRTVRVKIQGLGPGRMVVKTDAAIVNMCHVKTYAFHRVRLELVDYMKGVNKAIKHTVN